MKAAQAKAMEFMSRTSQAAPGVPGMVGGVMQSMAPVAPIYNPVLEAARAAAMDLSQRVRLPLRPLLFIESRVNLLSPNVFPSKN